VIPNAKSLQKPDRVLLRKNVRLDSARYAVWWALSWSKGDPFGKRKGKDGLDWTVTSGCQSSKHPIDIVALYHLYCRLMGFSTDTGSKKFRQQQELPFFQELDKRGRPTGAALSYNSLLSALKADIDAYFPDIDSAFIGTHSFRRFGATYCKLKGIPDDLIQFMGRWVSECFQRYFIFSDDAKVNMSRSMISDEC
jgi:hypothetical protein